MNEIQEKQVKALKRRRKAEPLTLIRFEDMRQGTHFTDGENCFIKLQNVLPSGLKATYKRFADGKEVPGDFNAVYYAGHPACVPAWREYFLL